LIRLKNEREIASPFLLHSVTMESLQGQEQEEEEGKLDAETTKTQHFDSDYVTTPPKSNSDEEAVAEEPGEHVVGASDPHEVHQETRDEGIEARVEDAKHSDDEGLSMPAEVYGDDESTDDDERDVVVISALPTAAASSGQIVSEDPLIIRAKARSAKQRTVRRLKKIVLCLSITYA